MSRRSAGNGTGLGALKLTLMITTQEVAGSSPASSTHEVPADQAIVRSNAVCGRVWRYDVLPIFVRRLDHQLDEPDRDIVKRRSPQIAAQADEMMKPAQPCVLGRLSRESA